MDLQAIREHAQDMLKYEGLAGRGAVLLGLVGNAERAHFEEVTALRLALDELTEDTPCRFDHHGYCQEHMSDGPCRNELAKGLLTGARRSDWMALWDAASEAFIAYENTQVHVTPAMWDGLHEAMGKLGYALAEHKTKWSGV